MSLQAPPVESNDPGHPGSSASTILRFGHDGRYVVCAVHTRLDAVSWIVTDFSIPDEVTGLPSSVIRQEESFDEAVKGL